MSFVELKYTKSQVDRAGAIIIAPMLLPEDSDKYQAASDVMSNWRAAHAYPINTFQATLRSKLKRIDKNAIVAQRLKRAPSILAKLIRFKSMRLARMQDIGGLRAVVSSISMVRSLEKDYRTGKIQSELVSSKDYITNPKADGYRSIHLIFKYKNNRAPAYEGLHVELQIRTKLQHAWATAVETMGTFLGQALKSGQGDSTWRDFFVLASAAIAAVEKSPPVPGFKDCAELELFSRLKKAEKKLRVIERLIGFAIAADHIETVGGQGAYHLVILDSEKKTVTIKAFSLKALDKANKEYAEVESKAKNGEKVEAVLVSAGPVSDLKKAYPNYFLDTQSFIQQLQIMIQAADGG